MEIVLVKTALGDLIIREATQSDAQPTMEIYNQEIQNSFSTLDLTPRTLKEQRRWLKKHAGAYLILVAELNKKVIGFASLSKYRNRPAYATTVEDSIYIKEEYRCQGIGKVLLSQLLNQATSLGFHAVIARIVSFNQTSANLHKSLGFELVGKEKEVGRKFGRWLDIELYEKLLS